ncbi:uncharacterized protein LOC120090822 [Benincasa hispida]|uniref:uncharacterized protein LOC120090822 n=1 Tax=Benincasa hispida TaxID=102211 RepID=UPI0019022938|nr:uncharacterized protein LOC120090822 [Benincasa hispida]
MSNVPFVPLDGVSFHTEESASLWKYVVKRNIVHEKELSDCTQKCVKSMELIQTASLERTVLNLGPYYPPLRVHIRRHSFVFSATVINQFLCRNVPENVRKQHPSLRDLVFELIGEARSTWPRRGQLPTAGLNVKYTLLHRIGIYSWCPSSHKSSLSIALATLMYQVGTRAQFNYDKPDLFTALEVIGPFSSLFSIDPKLLQGHYVLDLNTTTITYHLDGSSQIMASSFSGHILQLLSVESHDLESLVHQLQERKAEVDKVLLIMWFVLSRDVEASSSQPRS